MLRRPWCAAQRGVAPGTLYAIGDDEANRHILVAHSAVWVIVVKEVHLVHIRIFGGGRLVNDGWVEASGLWVQREHLHLGRIECPLYVRDTCPSR